METVKGFRDFIGEEAEKREYVKEVLVKNFKLYGFEPAETPIVEYRDFVQGNNQNDEAVSDIFKLKDKGNRDLALRYEFTFQLKRLMQAQKLPYKRYSIGPVFRDEPVSGNRLRQFTQCDIDIVSSSLRDEAEILAITKRILDELNVPFTIYFNNRKLLNEILEKENIKKYDFENVIREIDKLDKLTEEEIKTNLKKYNAEKILLVLKKNDFEQYENYKEILQLKEYAKFYDLKLEFSPILARGLSYYNGTVFEVKTKEMKETITAGGSYIFNNVQSTGISFGLERLSSLVKLKEQQDKYLVLSIAQDEKAIELAEKLRSKGKIVYFLSGKVSKALEYANVKKINKVIFLGEEEVKKKKLKLKDMTTGKEELVSLTKVLK